jgi:hypothetical protein
MDTEVPVSRSIDQIRQLVERFGALGFGIEYDATSGGAVAITFKVKDPKFGVPVPVSLRAPFEQVLKMILDGKRQAYRSDVKQRAKEVAQRVAWRNLHDFVRASLIGVQTGIMSLGEAFMASLIINLPNGDTRRFGELVVEGKLLHPDAGRLMLGPGSS